MSRRSTALAALGLFLALVAIYVASPMRTPYDSRWSIHTADSFLHGHGGDLSAYLPVLEKNQFYFIDYEHGRPHNGYPIGVSLMAAPFVAVIELVNPSFADLLKEQVPDNVEKVLASIFGAAAAVLFFYLVLDRFRQWAIALASTLIFALCTSMWSLATRALWQHGPLVLMFVTAMLLLQRAKDRPALVQYVSLPLAFAYIIRPTAAVPIVVISAFVLLYHRKFLIRYLGWAMLFALPWLAFNVVTYGRILPPYYLLLSPGGTAASAFGEALAGHLISPARGLFIYSPVLLFALPGFVLAWRDRTERPLHLAYAAIVVLILIAISLFPAWWAGHSFGPRYMIDVLPFLAYFTAFSFDLRPGARRGAVLAVIGVLAAISFTIHLRGATRSGPWAWNVSPEDVDKNPARLWDWRDPPFLRTQLP